MYLHRHVLLLAVAATAAGCNNGPQGDSSKEPAAKAITVSVIKPQRKALRRVVEQPGTVRADEETPIFARLAGFVSKVHVDIGDKVRGPKYDAKGKEIEPGQILAEVAIPEMVEEARQKLALVRQGEVEVEQAQKNLKIAEANVVAVEALVYEADAGLDRAQAQAERWKSESERIAKLFQKGVLGEQDRDEALYQYRAAEAARKEAKARIASAQAASLKSKAERDKSEVDVRLADARLQVARAESDRLQALLGYTKLRAPFDGIVTRRRVDTGHFLQPASGTKPDEAVFNVVRLDKVRVFVEVPEADAALVRDGAEARVVVQALKGAEFVGKVSRTGWALDPGVRTLRTEIDLPNRDGQLRPGMYAYARITGQLPEAWVLPATALAKHGEGVVCYRVEGGKAVRLPVLVGRSDGKLTEVHKKQGAEAGTWVDLVGDEEIGAGNVSNLTDGQPVRKSAGP